ncbi:hypothetical protein ABBQ32_007564 [Trebouxia sp. C0010 RCD-2024]
MNPDEEKAACEAPEESYTLDVELEPGYERPEGRSASASTYTAGRSKASGYADKSRSTSRSHQQWQGAQRSHSGSSSQGTKRRADSDAMLDPPYESKRARVSTPSAPRPQLDANRQKGPTQAEADAAGLTGSELQGGLRHSLRPKRPPSYPLKEESPPPQAAPRQHQGGARQGSSRTSSGQGQRAQAAVTRPTQKARKQHKGFEKLLALGGLWEIVKGKGKAITPAPFWVWEGLATHTPAAAELAAQAADVASAARYFEGSNYPSGAAHAAEAASLKRQAMAAAAVIGLDATSQLPDVITPAPSRSNTSAAAAAAAAAAAKSQQAATQSRIVSQLPSHASESSQALTQPGGLSTELPNSQLPTHGRSQSLSHILAQAQSIPQSHAQPQSQSQAQQPLHPQSQLQSQKHLQLPLQFSTQPQLQPESSKQSQLAPAVQQQQPQAQLQRQPQAQLQQQLQSQAVQLQQQLHQLPEPSSTLQLHLQQLLARQAAAGSALAPSQHQEQNRATQLPSQLHHQSRTAYDSGAELADGHQLQHQGQAEAAPAVSSSLHALRHAGAAQTASPADPHVSPAQAVSSQHLPNQMQPPKTEPPNELREQESANRQSRNGMLSVPPHKPQISALQMQNGKKHHVASQPGWVQEGRPPDEAVHSQHVVEATTAALTVTDRNGVSNSSHA